MRDGWIKADCDRWIREEILKQSKGVPVRRNVVIGCVSSELKRWIENGEDYYYLDHSYFNRGWANNNFRAIRKAFHLNTIKKRPDDRLRKFNVKIEPWRRNRGDRVVVIPVSHAHVSMSESIYGTDWTERTVGKLKQITGRSIFVKKKGVNSLKEVLTQDCWAVVCHGSVAGVEAALMGFPVFAGEKCCAAPISAGPLEKIDDPELVDFRHEWASSLAYASWHKDEIGNVNWLDYDYELRHDLSL